MMNSVKARIRGVSQRIVPDGYRNYGKYGVFPEDWRITTLGEITSRLRERNGDSSEYPAYSINNQVGFIPQKEQFEEGSYDDLDKSSYRIVERGQFAYNPARINVGSIGVLKDCDKAIISSLYVCFDTSKDVCKSYLENWFRTTDFYKEIIRNTEGSVREYLFYENFSNIRIALPPLEEQKRIAEILECCDKVIRLKRELVEEKKKQKKALMQKLLDSNSGFRLPGFNGEWRKISLEECGSFSKGFGITLSDCCTDGLPCIKYGDIYMSYDTVVYQAVSHIPQALFEQSKKISSGQLLFTCSGEDPLEIGKCVAYLGKEQIAVGGDIIVMTPIGADCLFLSYQQNSWPQILQKATLGKGNSIVHIHLEEIKKLQIELPPTIQEQQAIAKVLSSADHELDLLEQDLTQWELKKKSLMQLLLTGKVRTVK